MTDSDNLPPAARGTSCAHSLRETLLCLAVAAVCLGGFCAVVLRIVQELAPLTGV